MIRSPLLTLSAVLSCIALSACDSAQARSPERVAASSSGLLIPPGGGEHLRRRQYGFPATILIDSINGGAKHFVVGIEEIPPAEQIPVHKHMHAEEFIVLQAGTADVTLGDKVTRAKTGSTVYIPQDVWVGLKNVGADTMKIMFVFSAPGFDRYLRATSSPAGAPLVPFKPGELAAIDKKFRAEILFRTPNP